MWIYSFVVIFLETDNQRSNHSKNQENTLTLNFLLSPSSSGPHPHLLALALNFLPLILTKSWGWAEPQFFNLKILPPKKIFGKTTINFNIIKIKINIKIINYKKIQLKISIITMGDFFFIYITFWIICACSLYYSILKPHSFGLLKSILFKNIKLASVEPDRSWPGLEHSQI